MKNIIPFILILIVTLFSCKKEPVVTPTTPTPQTFSVSPNNNFPPYPIPTQTFSLSAGQLLSDTIMIKVFGHWVINTPGFVARIKQAVGKDSTLADYFKIVGDTAFIKYRPDSLYFANQKGLRLEYSYPNLSDSVLISKGMNTIYCYRHDSLIWTAKDFQWGTNQQIHPYAVWEWSNLTKN